MITAIRTPCIIFLLLQLTSCVIFNQPGTISNVKRTQENQIDPLELAIAKFPTISFKKNSTLYATVINYKAKQIGTIELFEDSANAFTTIDTVRFRLEVRDFDKTQLLTTIISCPISLIQRLDFGRISDGNYRIHSSNSIDSTKSCLLRNLKIESENNDLFYLHTGQLINANGNESKFWAQTDVVPTKVLYGAVVIASNVVDKVSWVKDLCKYKVQNAKDSSKCHSPVFKIEYYYKPLAEVFDMPIRDNFYKDCSVSLFSYNDVKSKTQQ